MYFYVFICRFCIFLYTHTHICMCVCIYVYISLYIAICVSIPLCTLIQVQRAASVPARAGGQHGAISPRAMPDAPGGPAGPGRPAGGTRGALQGWRVPPAVPESRSPGGDVSGFPSDRRAGASQSSAPVRCSRTWEGDRPAILCLLLSFRPPCRTFSPDPWLGLIFFPPNRYLIL